MPHRETLRIYPVLPVLPPHLLLLALIALTLYVSIPFFRSYPLTMSHDWTWFWLLRIYPVLPVLPPHDAVDYTGLCILLYLSRSSGPTPSLLHI